jgi:hypothetical protein
LYPPVWTAAVATSMIWSTVAEWKDTKPIYQKVGTSESMSLATRIPRSSIDSAARPESYDEARSLAGAMPRGHRVPELKRLLQKWRSFYMFHFVPGRSSRSVALQIPLLARSGYGSTVHTALSRSLTSRPRSIGSVFRRDRTLKVYMVMS